MADNPASREHVDPVPIPKPRPDAWSEEEAQAFLAASAESPYAVMWRFLLATGVRSGELLGLRWEHVDLEKGIVQIVRQRLRSKPGETMFGDLKTERSRRELILDPATVQVMTAHKEFQRELRAFVQRSDGEMWYEHDLVFCTRNGKPYDLTNVGDYWRRDVLKSGIRQLKLHGTRHTHATLLIERGVPIEVVSRRLGHASTAFTADVYFRPGKVSAQIAADKIAEALKPTEARV
jgi:integrase